MSPYTNVSGTLLRQPNGDDWHPGDTHDWPERDVQHLLLYRRVRPGAPAAAAPAAPHVPDPPEPAPPPAAPPSAPPSADEPDEPPSEARRRRRPRKEVTDE